MLLATLPRIIAVNWEPEDGKNQLDATVTNVLARLTQASTSTIKSPKPYRQTGTLRAAMRFVKAANAAQACQAGRKVDLEVTSTTAESV